MHDLFGMKRLYGHFNHPIKHAVVSPGGSAVSPSLIHAILHAKARRPLEAFQMTQKGPVVQMIQQLWKTAHIGEE